MEIRGTNLPRKKEVPDIYWVGSWGGPTATVDTMGKGKIYPYLEINSGSLLIQATAQSLSSSYTSFKKWLTHLSVNTTTTEVINMSDLKANIHFSFSISDK